MSRCAISIRNIFATFSTFSVLSKNHIPHYKHQSKCVCDLLVCDTLRGELIFVLGWGSNIGPHGPPYSIGPCVRRTQLFLIVVGSEEFFFLNLPGIPPSTPIKLHPDRPDRSRALGEQNDRTTEFQLYIYCSVQVLNNLKQNFEQKIFF